MAHLASLGSPIGQTRMVYSGIIAVAVAVFMYLATANMHWFTVVRLGYFIFGVVAGFLVGFLEAKLVISKLSQKTEVWVWQILPLTTVLLGALFLAALVTFGTTEYAPFGVFAFFPFMAADLAVSGYYFNQFDKENEVLTFGSFYAPKYWTQPNPDANDRLQYFLQNIASKDATLLWANVGYAGAFLKKLQKQSTGDLQTDEALKELLKTMRGSAKQLLIHFVLTLLLEAVTFGLLFGYPKGHIGSFRLMDVLIPFMLLLWVTLGVNLFVTMRLLKKKAAKNFERIDAQKLRSMQTSEVS